MKIVKIILFFLALISSETLLSQNSQENDIKKVINHFFKGLQSGDTIAISETIGDHIVLQSAHINKEGASILRTEEFSKFLNSVATKKPEDIWEENLLSYHIQIDGNMANVWTPYEFYFNKKFSHCGVNSFQLFFDGENWKIIYLIDTRRRKDCKQ